MTVLEFLCLGEIGNFHLQPGRLPVRLFARHREDGRRPLREWKFKYSETIQRAYIDRGQANAALNKSGKSVNKTRTLLSLLQDSSIKKSGIIYNRSINAKWTRYI